MLPEKIAALAPEEATKRQHELASLAQRAGVYLVVGVQLNHAERKDNASWLFSPTGELLAEYHKQHLVPHLESDLAPGKEEIVRTIDGAPFGLAICRDLIFTDFGRSYGRLGVSAMLVPAWDFYRDAWMASGVACSARGRERVLGRPGGPRELSERQRPLRPHHCAPARRLSARQQRACRPASRSRHSHPLRALRQCLRLARGGGIGNCDRS